MEELEQLKIRGRGRGREHSRNLQPQAPVAVLGSTLRSGRLNCGRDFAMMQDVARTRFDECCIGGLNPEKVYGVRGTACAYWELGLEGRGKCTTAPMTHAALAIGLIAQLALSEEAENLFGGADEPSH